MEFLGKLLLRLDGVARDAEYRHAGVLQVGDGVAKAARLDGATGRVGAWVEEEDDGAGRELGERDGVAVLVFGGETIDDVSGFVGALMPGLLDRG